MSEVSTVSQVNMYIKNMFARDYALHCLKVRGEISNCKYHSSGHIYFTIKDRTSQLSCVMFSSYRQQLDFRLQEGQSVVVQGNVSVYERDGKYQLYATAVSKEGAGKLYEEYERLKKRLFAEGLFDEQRKVPIPRFARRIGVVTAETGAVIQDICNVASRRNPYVEIVLYPARVQGEGAHLEIIKGIQYFEATDVDTIIIGRGGGSIEDLWEFNHEELAYVIAQCEKPIISAVGHETDTTISDYVADLRAPTPSAAAELAVYSYQDFLQAIESFEYDLELHMNNRIQMQKMRLNHCLAVLRQKDPEQMLAGYRLQLDGFTDKLNWQMEQKVHQAGQRLALYIEALKGISPLEKIQRGYAYVEDDKGSQVTSVEQLKEKQSLNLTLKDGRVAVHVDEIRREELWQGKSAH